MTTQIAQLQSLLPDSIHEVAAVIGMPATLRLVERFGGTTLPLPRGDNIIGRASLAVLAKQIGDDDAQKLAHHCAGEPLYIPRCDVALRRLRDLSICDQFAGAVRTGKTAIKVVAELALANKLTDRWIWKIVKETPPDSSPTTPDLFH
ncbi:Mor transcription activator family protein [Neptunomonas antarctica]|uniref:Mor transcription activator family protein n=1 Tax=Neptunomonas antarctica TaxID=619304 RepID=A0A1N7MPU1_9GAMM|nr:Mor transcription activator family protein [Neptunomonas antarctica]SIS88153.1 Mor transcription activator family protein [Neptunomonas antarctica]